MTWKSEQAGKLFWIKFLILQRAVVLKFFLNFLDEDAFLLKDTVSTGTTYQSNWVENLKIKHFSRNRIMDPIYKKKTLKKCRVNVIKVAVSLYSAILT